MKGEGVIDGGDIFEVDGVGNFEAFHAVGVPPLLEVHLEGSSAPVAVVSANLALVLNAEPVQLVQPVGNRLAVPTKRQVFGIVDGGVCFFAF